MATWAVHHKLLAWRQRTETRVFLCPFRHHWGTDEHTSCNLHSTSTTVSLNSAVQHELSLSNHQRLVLTTHTITTTRIFQDNSGKPVPECHRSVFYCSKYHGGEASTRMSPFCILLQQVSRRWSQHQNATVLYFIAASITEVKLTTGATRRASLQSLSSRYHQCTITQMLQARCLSCHSAERVKALNGESITFHGLADEQLNHSYRYGLILVLTIKGSWLPCGRVASPLMPVSH